MRILLATDGSPQARGAEVLVALGMGSLGLWPRFEVLLLVLGLAVLGSGLAVTGEVKEQQGLQGFPQVGGWHEGQDGPK